MDQTRTLNGQNTAPPAGKPGMGAGNVPFAPGIMSGKLGTSTPAPLARQAMPPGQVAPPPPGGPSAAPGPGQPPGPGAAPTPGIINPQIYFQVMNAWMESLIAAAETPGGRMFGLY